MALKVNRDAVKYAQALIEKGDYIVDTDWSETQPSTGDENDFAEKEGWESYSRWHLGLDTDYDKDEKSRYKFPYGDFKKVHRKGVIAAKQRAGQNDYSGIKDAADELLQMIDDQEDK